MVKVKGKKCYAYFKGKDGLGTCDTECQWYVEGAECPMWTPCTINEGGYQFPK